MPSLCVTAMTMLGEDAMNGKKVIGGFVVIALICLVAVPIGRFLKGARLYGEAEPVADLLASIYGRTQDMSTESVRAVLTNDDFRLLHSYQIEYATDTNIVLWIPVNRKFTVGLGRNAGALWQVNK